jgi:hypothetical protein
LTYAFFIDFSYLNEAAFLIAYKEREREREREREKRQVCSSAVLQAFLVEDPASFSRVNYKAAISLVLPYI